MRILFASSEAYPLIKTGGLADVSGSLPAALNRLDDLDARLLLPGYPSVMEQAKNLEFVTKLHFMPIVNEVRVLQGTMPDSGAIVYVIDCPSLFERSGNPYLSPTQQDWTDNPIRFAVLSKVAAVLASAYSPLDWKPDILHCNDWQTGLAPLYLQEFNVARAKTVMSLHNMAYQGVFPTSWLTPLQIPLSSYQVEGIEYYGQISFLKAGIVYADAISTVSPTYAQEIQTEAFGFGMQGLLTKRNADLTGILNGIDLDEWNPEKDHYLDYTYSRDDISNKALIKQQLQRDFGLPENADTPLLGVVSRLVEQKGLDLLLQIAPILIEKQLQLVILGSGEAWMQQGFQQLQREYPQQIGLTIGYNEVLSHKIMAGADIFIMPSRFEPCGLNQMYGLRYGTLPLVNKTGGLADSVTNTNEQTVADHTATGFVMPHANPYELLSAIENAVYYYHQPSIWAQLQQNAMQQNVGWQTSAKAYQQLYQSLLAAA